MVATLQAELAGMAQQLSESEERVATLQDAVRAAEMRKIAAAVQPFEVQVAQHRLSTENGRMKDALAHLRLVLMRAMEAMEGAGCDTEGVAEELAAVDAVLAARAAAVVAPPAAVAAPVPPPAETSYYEASYTYGGASPGAAAADASNLSESMTANMLDLSEAPPPAAAAAAAATGGGGGMLTPTSAMLMPGAVAASMPVARVLDDSMAGIDASLLALPRGYTPVAAASTPRGVPRGGAGTPAAAAALFGSPTVMRLVPLGGTPATPGGAAPPRTRMGVMLSKVPLATNSVAVAAGRRSILTRTKLAPSAALPRAAVPLPQAGVAHGF